MDQLPLPLVLKQLVSDFRGVKPIEDLLREHRGDFFIQDRDLDMHWESEDRGLTWTYRWLGTREYRTGRPVHPLTSPEWAVRRRYSN